MTERFAFFPFCVEKLILAAHGLNQGEYDDGFFPGFGCVEVLDALQVLVPQGHERGFIHGVELAGHFEQHFFHIVPLD